MLFGARLCLLRTGYHVWGWGGAVIPLGVRLVWGQAQHLGWSLCILLLILSGFVHLGLSLEGVSVWGGKIMHLGSGLMDLYHTKWDAPEVWTMTTWGPASGATVVHLGCRGDIGVRGGEHPVLRVRIWDVPASKST